MYELNRILLQSVGPKGARYEDVLLDYRDRDGAPARGSVMFLENGGGKSVLLKLAFSVVLPGRKNVLGAHSNTKTLENFVLTNDTSHVVLEWRRVGTDGQVLPELLLTGKVYEWKGRQHSSDSNNLREAWYTLRPADGALTLETLPTQTRRDGTLHKTPFAAYKEHLEAAHTAHPELDLSWTGTQRQWTDHLDALGLDPELFKYQREMNADEGDADELFAFRSHGAFVDFLLKAVTDREGPTKLATNVDQFADKLREREQLNLEWLFLGSVLEKLRPLAAAVDEREAASSHLLDVHRHGEDVYREFAAADVQATAEEEGLQALADQQAERARTLNTRGRELEAQLQLLRLAAAEFRLAAAEQALEKAESAYREANDEADAWRAAGPLADLRIAAAEAKTLADQLAAAERDAAPLMEQRSAAARSLAGALLAAADTAREAAGRLDREATERNADAKREEEAAREADGLAGQLRAEAGAAQGRLVDLDNERARLVAKRALARGQSPADALAALAAREQDADRREQEADARVVEIDRLLGELVEAASEASLDEQRATDGAHRLARERDELHARAQDLAAADRLRDLAGVDRIDLWKMSDPLQQALAEALATTERDLVLLELDAADDRRAAHALEETGRLPAARDAERAIEVLRAAQVSATSGWDYLAESVPPSERETVLRRLPDLVGGVVLHNAAHRERAEAVLAEAALRPTTVVAVGDTAELAGGRRVGRDRVVVAPNAALYDEAAGDDEYETRKQRLADVADRRHQLEETYRADQALRQRLGQLLSDYPTGRLDELAGLASAQRVLATQAHDRKQQADRERGSLVTERPKRLDAAKAARDDLRTIESRRTLLEAFAERAAEERGLRETLRECNSAANAASDDAENHARAAQELRSAAQVAVREADDERRRAGRLSDELGEVEGAGEDVPRAPADVPLEQLRSEYRIASQLVKDATTGSQLAAVCERAQGVEADARARVQQFGEATLTRAGELLAAATDSTARREGEQRAARALNTAGEVRAERLAERNQFERDVKSATPRDESGRGPRAQLTEGVIPRDLDHAAELIEKVERDRADAFEDQRAAAENARQAEGRAKEAGSRARVLSMSAKAIAGALASAGSDFDPATAGATTNPFAGAEDEAEALLAEVTGQLRDADNKLEQAEGRVRSLVEEVSRCALDSDFDALKGSPMRARLVNDDAATIARSAAVMVPHMQERADEIEKEIASIEMHRALLVERLAGLVQAALATLRSAGRASRLPAELGDWSGKQFLRIDFHEPENDDVLLERLRHVLDRAVSEGQNRDGMTMLLGGVREAVGQRGFNVTILKPDTVLRDERVPVPTMGEFSGGQRLTAAIALYCTLAAMRSHSRGRKQQRAGVLFLDNPIGTASAEYLLDIQLKVAERVGVQLVYTTGVYDLNALSKFPCLLRLRNDLDMRAGMSHIRVTDDLRQALVNGRALDDPAGYVDAARVVHDRTDAPTRA